MSTKVAARKSRYGAIRFAQKAKPATTCVPVAAEETYSGSCHCGDVTFEVKGLPEWTAICHCSICRITHSAPCVHLPTARTPAAHCAPDAWPLLTSDARFALARTFRYAELCAYGDDNIIITKGDDNLSMYNVRGKSAEDRYFCKTCGSKVYSKLNHLDCSAVFLQNLISPNHGADGEIDERFQMGLHIFYGSGTQCFFDELDKFETLPEAFGGDGVTLSPKRDAKL
jgi:hypothetical protein